MILHKHGSSCWSLSLEDAEIQKLSRIHASICLALSTEVKMHGAQSSCHCRVWKSHSGESQIHATLPSIQGENLSLIYTGDL